MVDLTARLLDPRYGTDEPLGGDGPDEGGMLLAGRLGAAVGSQPVVNSRRAVPGQGVQPFSDRVTATLELRDTADREVDLVDGDCRIIRQLKPPHNGGQVCVFERSR